MIHTFEILYILNRRAAAYCTYRLNKYVNASDRYSTTDIHRFLRIRPQLRRNCAGLHFKGLRIPGILQIDLLKYKDAPGSYFIYITIEPEVLLTGENTINVYYCSIANSKQLQTNYAKAIYTLFPKAFEGRPFISQVRFHDQKEIHPDDFKLGNLFMLPFLPLSILSRIDFCVNYKLDNAALYVEMIKKSYYNSRKKNITFRNLNPFSEDKSHDTLFYDKTSGFCIYDKFNKMMDPAKDNMHNIDEIREEAKDVIRIERPFYKITKEKLFSMTGLRVPVAEEGKEAPLKLGPLPLLYDESDGLKTIFREYLESVLGIKRNLVKEYMQNHHDFKWVSLKRFVREMDRLYEAGQITKQRHDTVLKMAYATSEAKSVKRSIENCHAGTHIWWGHDEEGNKIRVPFQRSKNLFHDTWHNMCELGMMLFRIPNNREVLGVENNDWRAKELDANFIFNIAETMVGIGTILEKEQSNHFSFLPYKFVQGRGLDTPDPLEIRQNYSDILYILYLRLQKYIDEREKRKRENK